MRKRANPDSEENIRRIDSKPKAKKQTHGFQVHFLRGAQSITKMFSDMSYGGKEGARRAARKFKKTAMSDLPERMFRGPVPAGGRGGKSASGSNSSGRGGAKKKATAGRKR